MAEKLGFENLKKVALVAAELGNVADKMGRLKGVARFSPLMELYDEAMLLNSIDLKQAAAELKDLDAAERAALHQDIANKLDLVDDNLEGVIEDGLAVLVDAVALFDRAKSLVGRLQKKA